MKKFFVFVLIAALLAAVLSCAKGGNEEVLPENDDLTMSEEQLPVPSEGGTLKLSMHGVDTLNPLVTKSIANSEILSLCFDGLFKPGGNLYPENALCESHFLSEDGLELMLNIRGGITFHGGEALTAEDVRHSVLVAKESGGVYSENLKNVADVRVVGSAVKIILAAPEFNFISKLTFPIVKADGSVREAIKNSGNYRPNGTGMYALSDYEFNKTLMLSAVNAYWNGKNPYIKDISVEIIKDRETAVAMFKNSLSDVLLPSVLQEGDYQTKSNINEVGAAFGSFVFLGINNQHPVLLDSNVKRAMSDAINRDSLVSLAGNRLKKATIPVYPESWLYTKVQETDYSPSEAKNAISELGWHDSDNDGMLDKTIVDEKTDLFLDILVNEDNQDRTRIAESLKKNFEEIGISITVTALPFWEYTERISSGNYDLFIGEVKFGDNQDISGFITGSGNLFRAYHEELYSTFDELMRTGDAAEIKEKYVSVCTELSESMPIIGLYFKNDSVLINSRIKGDIKPVRGNSFANIYDWFIY